MQLSTKGRYAVTAMLDLALHGGGSGEGPGDGPPGESPVGLAAIARRQDISLAYLEQLFGKLRRAGLVRGIRGPGGGYTLERGAESIFVAEIIGAVDESVDTTRCGGAGDCQAGEICLTHFLWEDLSEQILGFLRGVSLADLVARRDVRRIAGRQATGLKANSSARPAGEVESGAGGSNRGINGHGKRNLSELRIAATTV